MRGRLMVFCGIPGSGKTTMARLVAKANAGTVHIQTDAIRAMIMNPTFSTEESDFVYRAAAAAARESLDAGRMVILDATFGSRWRRRKTLQALAGHYSRVDIVHVACDLKTELKQNADRPKVEVVPEKTVRDIFRNFEEPEGAFKVDSSKNSPESAADRIGWALLSR